MSTQESQTNLFHQIKGTSKVDRVLWHLQEHGTITNVQIYELYGSMHGSSVIRDIRKRLAVKGEYEIVNEHKTGCDRYGDKVNWDVYTLRKKDDNRPVFKRDWNNEALNG